MQILALERELKPVDAPLQADLLREEAQRVWALKKSGIIRDIWFTRDGRNAVLMLECATEDEAAASLQALPLVREGFIRFEIVALTAYDGFERLMSKAPQ